MKKIDLKDINKKLGMQVHDYLRDGVAPDLDPLKVSAVIKDLVDNQNELIDLVLKMRDRKKPGPKTNKMKLKKKGGEIDK